MEGLDSGADGVLVCGDPGVGRDNGAPVTPRTPDEYLVSNCQELWIACDATQKIRVFASSSDLSQPQSAGHRCSASRCRSA